MYGPADTSSSAMTLSEARSLESSFGISSIVAGSAFSDFSGVLKARFSDFVVKEVNLDGEVATYEKIDAPNEEEKAEEVKKAAEPKKERTYEERCGAAATEITSWCELKEEEEREKVKTDLLAFLLENKPKPKEEKKVEEEAKKVEEEAENKVEVAAEAAAATDGSTPAAPAAPTIPVPAIFTLPKLADKSNRGKIHSTVRAHLSAYFLTDTHEGAVRVIPESEFSEVKAYGRFGGGKNQNKRGSNGGGGGKNKKRKLQDKDFWPPARGDYLQFVLYKENVDTMHAIKDLEHKLRVKSGVKKGVGYGGTKDKRAVTGQFVTVYRKRGEDLEWINQKDRENAIYGGGGGGTGGYVSTMRVGRFKYVKSHTNLGMLRGNQFTIVLRNLKLNEKDKAESLLATVNGRCKSVKENGFVNYFGMQR